MFEDGAPFTYRGSEREKERERERGDRERERERERELIETSVHM